MGDGAGFAVTAPILDSTSNLAAFGGREKSRNLKRGSCATFFGNAGNKVRHAQVDDKFFTPVRLIPGITPLKLGFKAGVSRGQVERRQRRDRKSTRLNSSH